MFTLQPPRHIPTLPWLFSNSGPVVKLSMNILAGSRVLSAVGTRPPHDWRKMTLADQCVKRVLLSRASQSQGRSQQRQRPGRDVVFPLLPTLAATSTCVTPIATAAAICSAADRNEPSPAVFIKERRNAGRCKARASTSISREAVTAAATASAA